MALTEQLHTKKSLCPASKRRGISSPKLSENLAFENGPPGRTLRNSYIVNFFFFPCEGSPLCLTLPSLRLLWSGRTVPPSLTPWYFISSSIPVIIQGEGEKCREPWQLRSRKTISTRTDVLNGHL